MFDMFHIVQYVMSWLRFTFRGRIVASLIPKLFAPGSALDEEAALRAAALAERAWGPRERDEKRHRT